MPRLKTVATNLLELKDKIAGQLNQLLTLHSKLSYYHDYIPGLGTINNLQGNNHWSELPVEGKRLQSLVLSNFNKYQALVKNLISEAPEDFTRAFDDACRPITSVIEQNQTTHLSHPKAALDKAIESLSEIQEVIKSLYSNEGGVFLLPDTNALLYNHELSNWRYSEYDCFTLILVPSVLGELDKHKVDHRNEEVRRKAESLIRQIKEFRRRGSLADGVAIVNGQIYIRAIATEPRIGNAVPWLDINNQDDRFLASAMECMRANTRSALFIVTRDINMQNKCEYSYLLFIEPPEVMTETSEEGMH